jgi:hypothetical protein
MMPTPTTMKDENHAPQYQYSSVDDTIAVVVAAVEDAAVLAGIDVVWNPSCSLAAVESVVVGYYHCLVASLEVVSPRHPGHHCHCHFHCHFHFDGP